MYQPLSADSAALMVIDVQERLMAAIANRDEVVRNASLLLRLADIQGIPKLVTTQYKAGIGPIVPSVAELLGESQAVFDKTEFSCLANEGAARGHEQLGRKRLVVTGVEAHICVYQTALACRNAGYEVTVVADAVGSRTSENHVLGLERMQSLGCEIASAEMVIYEFLGKAGTPDFKKLLPHLKG
jgi:nicotinamidase-related amidase